MIGARQIDFGSHDPRSSAAASEIINAPGIGAPPFRTSEASGSAIPGFAFLHGSDLHLDLGPSGTLEAEGVKNAKMRS